MPTLIDSTEPVKLSADFTAAVGAFTSVVVAGMRATASADFDFQAHEAALLDAARRLATSGVREVAAATRPTTEFIEVDGVRHKRMAEAKPGTYEALDGEFQVRRHLYRQVGVHNGPTVDPIAVRCGMVDGRYTPAAAAGLAHLAQTAPSREASTLARSLHVLPYSRSTFDRMGTLVGQCWDDIRTVEEQRLIEVFEVPEEAVAVSFAVDRVSVPMEEDRELTAEDIERGILRPVEVNLRMAYCGVWTLHDAEGEALHSVRYAWLAENDGREAIEDALAADARALFEQRSDLRFVTLADGAPEMQHMLDRALDGLPVQARLVDFWHLLEKLADAAKAMDFPAEFMTARWRAMLLSDDYGIEVIERQLRSWAEPCGEVLPEGLHDALTYIENHRERLRYASVRQAKLPIGSGHVEATCKTIVSVRMKRSGARWRPPGGQAILHLRSLATSSRWSPAMRAISRSYERSVREVA
jgi:hypothetical protein